VKKINTKRTVANPDQAVRFSGRARAQHAFFYTTTPLPEKLRLNRSSLSEAIIILIIIIIYGNVTKSLFGKRYIKSKISMR
jgi:hypothetical protein